MPRSISDHGKKASIVNAITPADSANNRKLIRPSLVGCDKAISEQ